MSKKPEWYELTVRQFIQYPSDLIRLENLQDRLIEKGPSVTAKVSQAPSRSIGSTSDQTGQLAAAKAELESEIEELQRHIKGTKRVLEYFGPEEKKLIELKYMNRFSKDWYVADELHLPLRTYYRMKDDVVAESAVMLGYAKREQVSLWEMEEWR